MADVVNFRGTPDELNRILALIPRVLSGELKIPVEAQRPLQLRLGVALLSQIQQDFLVKSRGGTGRDGIKWPPLTRTTIAARRVTGAERKAAGITGRRERGLLTPAENRRWKAIYASNLARMRAKGIGGAEGRAAAIAWGVLKSEGAKTRLQVFGGRQVDIGRDTGIMFRSLTPGVEDQPSGEPDQIFRLIDGGAIVGSNVPYFEAFHRRRNVWPYDGTIPPAWMEAIERAAVRGIIEVLLILLRSGWKP